MNEKHGYRWNRPLIKREILRFRKEHGRNPTAEEWKKAGDWPSYSTVRRQFGSWGEGIEYATGERPVQGRYVRAHLRYKQRGNYRKKRNAI